MPVYFFDSSALVKYYQTEAGSADVHRVVEAEPARHLIARLTVVEVHSSFAKKLRTGDIGEEDFASVWAQFVADISAEKFTVLRVADAHYEDAIRLLRTYARRSLSTLDALQLASALAVHRTVPLDQFLCADILLADIAQEEGLSVFNPS